MNTTHVVGVDPGIVHTGTVRLEFDPVGRNISVDHEAIPGPDGDAVRQWICTQSEPMPHIFIEGYRTRSNFGTDTEMVNAVQKMKARLPHATVLTNTGVKKVVRRPLMELLGCWSFSTPTHHQDLRSAARIALLGMLKSEHLNRVLTAVVTDHLEGRTWGVHHRR